VPAICHLVFLRRVKSRILYEQMIGRATRRCDEIGKTVFKIYDPVDIYASLQPVNTMQPLVKDPNVTLEQLIDELNDPANLPPMRRRSRAGPAHRCRGAGAFSLPKVVLQDHLDGSLRPQTLQLLLDEAPRVAARSRLLAWATEHGVHAGDGPH
jgi:type I restriction enzyme, R subunit